VPGRGLAPGQPRERHPAQRSRQGRRWRRDAPRAWHAVAASRASARLPNRAGAPVPTDATACTAGGLTASARKSAARPVPEELVPEELVPEQPVPEQPVPEQPVPELLALYLQAEARTLQARTRPVRTLPGQAGSRPARSARTVCALAARDRPRLTETTRRAATGQGQPAALRATRDLAHCPPAAPAGLPSPGHGHLAGRPPGAGALAGPRCRVPCRARSCHPCA
jgi:hypothetical protein